MPTMRIVLQVNEQEALQEMAKRELRDPRAQAVFIIRHKLKEIGLLSVGENTAVKGEQNARNENAQ